MFLKGTLFILGLTAIGVALLELRHQRVQMMHDMAVMHRHVDRMRHAMWQSQAAITRHLDPDSLRASLASAQLQLEPVGEPLPVPSLKRPPTRALAAKPAPTTRRRR